LRALAPGIERAKPPATDAVVPGVGRFCARLEGYATSIGTVMLSMLNGSANRISYTIKPDAGSATSVLVPIAAGGVYGPAPFGSVDVSTATPDQGPVVGLTVAELVKNTSVGTKTVEPAGMLVSCRESRVPCVAIPAPLIFVLV